MGDAPRDVPWLRGLVIAAIGAALGVVAVAIAVAGDGPTSVVEVDRGASPRVTADATSIADASQDARDPSPGGPPSDDSWGALGP